MNRKIINIRSSNDNKKHYDILPIESSAAFEDLLNFVCTDFTFNEVNRIEGPDSTVCYLQSDLGDLIFVLSDMIGTHFYTDDNINEKLAQRVAKGIEERILELIDDK